ncbi:MAG: hypothetical protein V4820_04515 [Pseudomonadota bacterium]|uniref:hypothetical protein n=1 Tax=Phenylobacterium sp. TaxID=1871053 RepID=UPI0027239333|nr:hypothetical protein [Phenylobacterium sp.]MDO9432416.1 hypothetical protein [Phenylobacterium sp.]
MMGAILPIAAAAMLAACATTPTVTASARPQGPDYSNLSCSQLTAELALTHRAYISASKRERQPREGQTAQAFLFPASLGAAPSAASARLLARLEDLKRASRAKRCSSMSKTATA